ncbi:cytochrome c oxidase assembly protein [Pseudogracilibacillus sp. SO30301A]|uniref:cytochrome c oxidase assembly protein n=1 Tax=Pseudogracilibacillus sp. SO30301A TaxID=3098291 RepID=UPI00300E1975
MSSYIGGWILEEFLLCIFISLIIGYGYAVKRSNQTYRKWPLYRVVCWILGVICIAISVIGPIAQASHENFIWHMAGHLLLGMLGPIFLAVAAPMTLLLRILPVQAARRVTRVLRSRILRFYTNPLVATIINIGGLWILYTSPIYEMMLHSTIIHVLIHLHVFFVGYLFTISLIYIDPVPHQVSFLNRTIVFVIALAGHGILSKYIYATPPNGVDPLQAKIGGMLMYYGGDAIDLIIIIILFYQWYTSTRPRTTAVSIT